MADFAFFQPEGDSDVVALATNALALAFEDLEDKWAGKAIAGGPLRNRDALSQEVCADLFRGSNHGGFSLFVFKKVLSICSS